MMDDPAYLKRYVKKHPENKMAWYLLGKHYASEGKDGKAKYCFAKAGEIFEAFEKAPAPDVRLEQFEPKELSQAAESRTESRNGRCVLRAAMAAILVLAGLFYPVTFGPNFPREDEAVLDQQPSPWATPSVSGGPVKSVTAADISVIFLENGADKPEWEEVLKRLVVPQERRALLTVLVKPVYSEDGHLLWREQPDILLSVEQEQSAQSFKVLYYNSEACSCKPADPTIVTAAVRMWMKQEEELAVLRSAVMSYREGNGVWPAAVEALADVYPKNVISGYTAGMKEAFGAQVKAAASARGEAPPAPAVTQTADGAAVPSDSGPNTARPEHTVDPLGQKLEIKVDTGKHRLALVSGSTIVRSYPVGLGGPRTPKGVYAISEKVMNPNDRSDGAFGSRGMQLSDTRYAIHGTNKPSSIGKDQSLGCIRMLRDDIEELYAMAPLGTKVSIGDGNLPDGGTKKAGDPFRLPQYGNETNPGYRYNWLD